MQAVMDLFTEQEVRKMELLLPSSVSETDIGIFMHFPAYNIIYGLHCGVQKMSNSNPLYSEYVNVM